MAKFGKKTKKSGKAFGLQFAGWQEKMEQLDRLSHFGILEGTKEALLETHKVVTPRVEEAMQKHVRTGRTKRAIIENAKVETDGLVVSIDIGFDLSRGGHPSIWLMYGTPRQQPDKKLYQAIFGKSVSDEIQHVQYQAIKRTIEKYTK